MANLLSLNPELLALFSVHSIVFCFRQPMPVLPEQAYTKLDVNMRKHRMAELVGTSLLRWCSFCLICTECDLV